MAALLACTNKGCYQSGEHKLDIETGKVICEYCAGEVNVSPYMKTILKNSKQVLKRARSNSDIKCAHCGTSDSPVLLEIDKNWVAGCKHCKGEHAHLTKFFVKAMTLNKDIERVRVDTTGKVSVKEPVKVAAKPAIKRVPVADLSTGKVVETVPVASAPAAKAKKKAPHKPRLASDFLRQAGFKNLADQIEP